MTKTFNNLSFSNEKELCVTFQVPPNLNNVHVELRAEVANATTKSTERFCETESFKISANDAIPDDLMQLPYLKRNNGDYELHFLGRNGEPAQNKKVEV